MIVRYRETLKDGRAVLIEANYQEPVYTPGAEEPEQAYVVRILDQKLLDDLSADVSRDRADLRLALAKEQPAEYQRLRRECLERVLFELDVIAGETCGIRRDAAVTR